MSQFGSLVGELWRNNGHIVRTSGVFVACVQAANIIHGVGALEGNLEAIIAQSGTRHQFNDQSILIKIDKKISRMSKVLHIPHPAAAPSSLVDGNINASRRM